MLTQVTDSKITTTLSIVVTVILFVLNLVFKIQVDDVAKAAILIFIGIIYQFFSHTVNNLQVTIASGIGAIAILANTFLHLNIPPEIQKSFSDIIMYVLSICGIFLTDKNAVVPAKAA